MDTLSRLFDEHRLLAGILALVLLGLLIGAFTLTRHPSLPGTGCTQSSGPRAGVTTVLCGSTRFSDRTAREERTVEDHGDGPVAWELTFSGKGTVRSNTDKVTSVNGQTTVVVSWDKDWGELTSIRPLR